MDQFPLVFSLQAPVLGPGFLAHVEYHGSALAREESANAWWIDGVHPGGITETGGTLELAYSQFREGIVQVLTDIALDVDSFANFKLRAEKFFNESDTETEASFELAREGVRKGLIGQDSQLPKVQNPKISCRVTQMTSADYSPEQNQTFEPAQIAA